MADNNLRRTPKRRGYSCQYVTGRVKHYPMVSLVSLHWKHQPLSDQHILPNTAYESIERDKFRMFILCQEGLRFHYFNSKVVRVRQWPEKLDYTIAVCISLVMIKRFAIMHYIATCFSTTALRWKVSIIFLSNTGSNECRCSWNGNNTLRLQVLDVWGRQPGCWCRCLLASLAIGLHWAWLSKYSII